MQRRVIRPIIGSLLALWILHQTALLGDEKPKEAAKADAAQIQRLIQQLGDDDFKKREEASKKLVEIGPAALPELERAVKGDDREVVQRAKVCVRKIQDLAAVPGLIEKLGDSDKYAREYARGELERIGQLALPALIKALKHKNKNVRIGAAMCLPELRERAKDAVSALIECLDDKEVAVRERAAVALGFIGPSAKPAVHKLTEIFDDPKTSKDLRWCAGGALGGIGPGAEDSVPTLLRYVKDRGNNLLDRAAAAMALGKIGPSHREVIPSLINVLKDKKDRLRRWAAIALGDIGPKAKEAVPELVKAVQANDEPELQFAAVGVLGKFGPAAKEAVPALVEVLKKKKDLAKPTGEDLHLGINVILTLGNLGPSAADALPVLHELADIMKNRDRSTAGYLFGTRAVEAIKRIAPESK